MASTHLATCMGSFMREAPPDRPDTALDGHPQFKLMDAYVYECCDIECEDMDPNAAPMAEALARR